MFPWPSGLMQTLARHTDLFAVEEIRMPERLAQAAQTGFVWTHQPGVVCLAMTKAYLSTALENPHVVAIIVPRSLVGVDGRGKAIVVAGRPDELYHMLHLEQSPLPEVEALEIDPSARIDASSVLRGAVRVGANSVIGPRVVVEGPVTIGADCRIEAGVVIGCEGLYAKEIAGERRHIPHFGGVEIEDGAFVHAGAVIVRSAIRGESTRIGRRAHVGVLTNIGHDVQIGEEATISSNVVIAGRAVVGAGTWIGASATISNMVHVGERAEVRLGSVVLQEVPPQGDVSGNFARRHARNMKQYLKDLRDEP